MCEAPDFERHLLARAELVGATVSASAIESFERYLGLLARWNRRINLTALPLRPATDETLDRLLIEPLVAASAIRSQFLGSQSWVDVGSGGGSPAIPIKVVNPGLSLTMVEAKQRKAAFLGEVVRALSLEHSTVVNERLEALPPRFDASANLVTLRAVAVTDNLLAHVRRLLRREAGRLFLFHSAAEGRQLHGFEHVTTRPLRADSTAWLSEYRVFHVEHCR
jgi:16S rRNA (guanine(527)-N(7))-methyltransferase RsmG